MLSGANDTPTPQFKKHDKVQGLYIPLEPLGKGFKIFIFYCIYIFRAPLSKISLQPLF